MMTDADVVSTTVYIESENEPEIDLSGKCPGDTTLIDYTYDVKSSGSLDSD